MRSGVHDQPGQYGETPSILKIEKLAGHGGTPSLFSATWEAEAGESLEPGRWRLQWAEITPLQSSLGNRVRFCLKKKERKRKVTCHLTIGVHSDKCIVRQFHCCTNII